MEEFLAYIRKHKEIAVISAIAAFVIILGLFCHKKVGGDIPVDSYNALGWGMRNGACNPQAAYAPQPMMQRNYPYYQQPLMSQAIPPTAQMQTAAFQSSSLRLPIGVTLQGRGTVMAVDPGSPAQRAGIQIGDVINRINGQ